MENKLKILLFCLIGLIIVINFSFLVLNHYGFSKPTPTIKPTAHIPDYLKDFYTCMPTPTNKTLDSRC